MADEPPWYRADVRGMTPGDATTRTPYTGLNDEWAFVTRNLDVGRAFAVVRGDRSVYEVELDPPVYPDPDFAEETGAQCFIAHWATVVRTVEKTVTMTIDEARRLMSQHALWRADHSCIYDDDGHATVPPEMRDGKCSPQDLRQLGTYPPPQRIVKLASHIAAGGSAAGDRDQPTRSPI
jgi:hypothetical protein